MMNMLRLMDSSFGKAVALLLSMCLGTLLFLENDGKTFLGSMFAIDVKDGVLDDHHNSSSLPHILFFIVDDLGSNDLGMHGSGIHTPHSDHLASTEAGGVYLDNYYVLPVCSATRASFLSGRYPLHTGCHSVLAGESPLGLPLDEETLPQVLKRAGYRTHGVGKWHVGHAQWEQTPTFRGFESFYGLYHGGADYYSHRKDHAYDLHWDEREFCGGGCSQLVDERGNYSTHVFTRQAIRIIENHTHHNPNEPLFLYLAHQAVHAPTQVPEEYQQRYENRTDWTDLRKGYAGMLTAVDESLAQVTEALVQANMWNNTLVVYTTDNGGPTAVCMVQGSSNRGRGGKCTIYEGGTRGDAFVSGPVMRRHREAAAAARAGTASPQSQEQTESSSEGTTNVYSNLFHAVDWLPTLAALAGASPAGKPLDGVSQWEALKGHPLSSSSTASFSNSSHLEQQQSVLPPKPPRDEVYVGYSNFDGTWYGPAIRWRQWKLIQGESGGPEADENATSDDDLSPLDDDLSPLDEDVLSPLGTGDGEPTTPVRRKRMMMNKRKGPKGGGPYAGGAKGFRRPARGGRQRDSYLLYNLLVDPDEGEDLSRDFPDIVHLLQRRLRFYDQHATFHPRDGATDDDGRLTCPAIPSPKILPHIEPFGKTWIPWCDGATEVRVYGQSENEQPP